MAPVLGRIVFLARDERYNREKPYSLRYVPFEEHVTENIEREVVDELLILDIRNLPERPVFDKNGFTICHLQSQLEYQDWFKDDLVRKLFFPEIGEALRDLFGACDVQIFEYRIRRRSKAFPVSTGNTLDWAQPVTATHIDFNLSEVRKMIHYHNGEKAHTLLKHRFQCVNIWKPLRGPVRDWPLALCDATSVDPVKDLIASDVVYADHVEENIQVHYSPKQKWLYLSDQQPTEMYVFRCADSREDEVGPGVPHASFQYPAEFHDGELRESIEARVLIYYPEES